MVGMNAFALEPSLMLAALWLAMGIDRAFGEPPRWLHPVVGMGSYFSLWQKKLLTLSNAAAFALGALAWLLGANGLVWAAWWLQSLIVSQLHPILAVLALAVLLKPMLAWRMLRREVLAVEVATNVSLQAGRERLAWLVSRDVTALSETQVRETAIESLAENLNDSVVAPVFWFLLLGLPGAALYRFANTADAMWGYRGRFEWAGKWAARADDALSYLPARITAGLIFLLERPCAGSTLRHQARQTPSPNSGWPMAAMALALGVVLEKAGVYVLNPRGRAASSQDLHRALKIADHTVVALVLISSVAIVLVLVAGLPGMEAVA
jgi:adenosylcobinamide-phosphate synthase